MMTDPNIDPDEAMKSGCFVVLFYMIALIVGLALCALLGSCTTTEYVTVEKIKHDTTYVSKVQRDSIYVHDSTAVERKDSIIKIEHWHTKYVDHAVHDTLYQATHDTIPQPYPVIKVVEKQLSKAQIALMIIGGLSLMAIFVFISVKLKRFLPLR